MLSLTTILVGRTQVTVFSKDSHILVLIVEGMYSTVHVGDMTPI